MVGTQCGRRGLGLISPGQKLIIAGGGILFFSKPTRWEFMASDRFAATRRAVQVLVTGLLFATVANGQRSGALVGVVATRAQMEEDPYSVAAPTYQTLWLGANGQMQDDQTTKPPATETKGHPFSRRNTWSLFEEYSPSSSHKIAGFAEDRKLFAFGGEYAHRLSLHKWTAIYFLVRVRPVLLVGDPVLVAFRDVNTQKIVERVLGAPRPIMLDHDLVPLPVGIGNTIVVAFPSYGRKWTYSAGVSPLGLEVNLLPRRRLQPLLMASGGFVVSSRDVPIDDSSRFNFTYEFGGGVEWFYKQTGSVRVGFEIHHISNAHIGATNPGIDSGLFQFTYCFGR